MISKFLGLVEARADHWSGEILVGVFIFMVWRLTNWATVFATGALANHVDLMGVAATITATAGLPLGAFTLVFNKWVELKNA